MAKFVLFLSLIICLVKINNCRVIRAAETSDLQTTIFTDLPNEAKKTIDTLHSMVLDFFDVKDTSQLTTKFQDQANSYSQQITTLVGTFTEEAKANSVKLDAGFKGILAKITENVETLKNKDPKLYENFEQYKNSFETTLGNVITETTELGNKLREKGSANVGELEKVVKNIYQETIDATKSISANIAETVKEKSA